MVCFSSISYHMTYISHIIIYHSILILTCLSHIYLNSGRCSTQVVVDSPVQYGAFNVTCPTCGVRNKVDVPLPPPRFISPSDRNQIVAMNYNEETPTTATNTMRMPVKRALLVGINYIGNRAQLRGMYMICTMLILCSSFLSLLACLFATSYRVIWKVVSMIRKMYIRCLLRRMAGSNRALRCLPMICLIQMYGLLAQISFYG